MKENREERLSAQPMFGDRKTLMEAFDYARMVIERGPKDSYIYNLTALMVIWNTLSKNYEPLIRKTINEPIPKTKD
jgi:hypothetical protein